jgi:hypothetical protein
MKIEWNRVTWYSKLLAVIVFLATFGIAFDLGVYWEQIHVETAILPTATTDNAPVHCGGFIKNAPTCGAGFHCQLSHIPDTGGTCVPD